MPKLDHNYQRRSDRSRMLWFCGLLAIAWLVVPCSNAMAEASGDSALKVLVSQVGFIGQLGVGIRLFVLFVVLILLPMKSILATVYYVRKTGNDGNAGTSPAAAWKTIDEATSSTDPGDIVYFGAGTYTEKVEPSVDGTNGNPIQFIADTDGTMTGDAGDVIWTGDGEALKAENDDYLEFEGFRITAPSDKEALKSKDCDGFVLRNCEIYGAKKAFKLEGSGSALLVNCLIHDQSDGAVELKGTGTVTIWNCTIADTGYYGIKTKESVVCTVKNTIIANNDWEGYLHESGTLTRENNIVYGNNPNFSGISKGTSEIVSDPLFEDSANNDYRLQDGSPAIDAGTNASGTVDLDLDDYYRPISTAWDIGCYEKCLVGPVLMVTSDDVSPSTQDVTKLLLIQS